MTLAAKDVAADQDYGTYLKPKIHKLLKAAGLDKTFVRAEGDYLYYLKDNGREQRVTDFLGGYGVSFFGHNHPRLLKVAVEIFKQRRPFVAQASLREHSSKLAKKLASMLEARTNCAYITTLANSGTEVVEAAIKHAALEKQSLIQDIVETTLHSFESIRLEARSGAAIPVSLFQQAETLLDVESITNLNELEYHLVSHQQNVFEKQPIFIALKGAFHGKSSGSLKLTYNKSFRSPWNHIGIQTKFVERNNNDDLEKAINDSREIYYTLEIDRDKGVVFVEKQWTTAVACFIEPIQGEGGIHELSNDFAQTLAALTQANKIPLVMDEIQSGMGRTGSFLASEALGITADYYLLSKALGGGLAKVAALLIKQDRYIEDFGYLHTSTFAEDDFSSAIALKALELLEEKDGFLMRSCGEKGKSIKQKLEQLVERYPNTFKEVRGRGLLLGLELQSQDHSQSNFIRLLSEQNLLAYLICGYLLNVHNIRMTPTLSADTTIRIEPSAYIDYTEVDALCLALEDVATCLENCNSHALAHFLFKDVDRTLANRTYSNGVTTQKNFLKPKIEIKSKVACVGHFMEAQDVVHWDPYLAPMTDKECLQLLERTQRVLEPFLVDEQTISSLNGDTIKLSLIGIPYTADQLINFVRGGEANTALELVAEAHKLAVRTGAIQVGFTGYSSIATNNCTAIVDSQTGVTSGNSLTAALGLDALHKVMDELSISNEDACLGVVGGVGNIGRILAEIEAEVIPKIVLIGREGSQRRLKKLAAHIYTKAWNTVMTTNELTGIAKSLSGLNLNIPEDLNESEVGNYILDHVDVNQAPIQISTSMTDLQQCNIIITATNTPKSLIFADHISEKPTVICDISVPSDVDKDLTLKRPNARVIKGGLVQLPQGQSLELQGMPLEAGQLYACLAETVLLGLTGISENFSYGALEASKIKRIREISKSHGFTVLVKEN